MSGQDRHDGRLVRSRCTCPLKQVIATQTIKYSRFPEDFEKNGAMELLEYELRKCQDYWIPEPPPIIRARRTGTARD